MTAIEHTDSHEFRFARERPAHRLEGNNHLGLLASRPSEDRPTADSELDPEICWQAIYSRDPRFDGRFFAAVRKTHIYCRPICPVPLRKPENVQWFRSAAAAEVAGFRPCRRCRPHTSPGTPAWIGTSAVVSRALNLISEGTLDSADIDALAERVGIGSRHLRRLFVQHLGAAPVRIAGTRRVHFAQGLIEETDLSITKIAFYSGFKSIRQFNHAMRAAFGHSPSKLRILRNPVNASDRAEGIVIHLSFRPPFDWAHLIRFLQQRATPGIEAIDNDCYARTIEVGEESGEIEVRPDDDGRRLQVRIKLPSYERLMTVIERVRRIFDLGADPLQIASHLSRDSRLRASLEVRPGLRVPGVWDGFELAVRTVLGQQITVIDPTTPISRLVRIFGRPVESSVVGLTHLFPRPQVLARADLSRAGIRGASATNLRALAHAVSSGKVIFEASRSLEDTIERLCSVRGIDPRQAHHIAMRAYGEPDAFPSDDLDLRHAVENRRTPVSNQAFLEMAEAWRPWRAYAVMHLSIKSTDTNTAKHRR
jgi:AraC family transcriptional regulator, regulatory protein of adaptative response / DNA-3-methyladenine glycosylase II